MVKNVLIIDDDMRRTAEAFNELAVRYQKDVTFHYAEDGQKGLELIALMEGEEVKTETIYCIYLDLNMPLLTGDEVLKELQTKGKKYPVVITSMDQYAKERVQKTGYKFVVGYESILTDAAVFRRIGEQLPYDSVEEELWGN